MTPPSHFRHPRTRGAREDGASAVEYAFLVAAIAAVIVVAAVALGVLTLDSFGSACHAIDDKLTSVTADCG